MEQTQTPTQPPPPQQPPLPTTTTTIPPTPTYPDSLDSSPRSRNTDSWGDETTNTTTTTFNQPPPQSQKLRLMCSYGGHIVPRPHDKSLCYIGGDTRIVVVDRHTSLVDLTNRLTKTLIKSQSSSSLASSQSVSLPPFTLKYQLPSEDLDSLISVTTDEDLENMIDEYERLNADVSKSSRLRLFLFPNKPESVTSIGSLLENSTKSEDWFLNALNGTTSGFSDTSSVNCLLGLDDDVLGGSSVQVNNDGKKESGVGGLNKVNSNVGIKGGGGQDVHSVPDLERTSSFGSASSSPSLASLPPIRVHVEEGVKVVEEQFGNMNVNNAPVVVTGVPVVGNVNVEYGNRVLSEDERSDQGSQHGYQKVVPVQVQVQQMQSQQQQQQQQYQQKPSMGFDLASPDSVSSDGSRQKPTMIYQDPLVQIQSGNNVNRTGELSSNNSNASDQNARIQMQQQQQQQQMADSAYLMSMSNTQVDPQHTQMHHQQQPQFIHTAVPQPQYIQHHPSGAVPMASYYQMYPSQSQHHPHHPALEQQNFVYYMPAPVRQAPQGYNMPMQQQGTGYAEVSSGTNTPLAHSQVPPSGYTTARTTQTVPKSELPAGVYGTNSGGSQYVQVPSSQHQVQPQYVQYSQMHHPSQSVASSASSAGANYGYEFADPSQGQHVYYAAQPLPPQSTAQYQTVTGGESGSYLPSDSSTKQQQGRTQQS